MTEMELDEMLNTWKTPSVPPSMRAGLRLRFPADPVRRVFGMPVRSLAAFALGAGALALGTSLVEDGVLSSDAGRLDDNTYMRRTRIVEPPMARLKWMFMGGRSTGWQRQAGNLTGSVYLYDRLSHEHFGYTWSAQPLGTGRYLFAVRALDPSVLKEEGRIVAGAPVPLRIVAAGSAFGVNLYASGNERVYDRIELSAQPQPLVIHQDPAQTAATLTLTNPKLYINGKLAADSGGVSEVKGATATIDLPARGRYVLALDPQGNSGFLPAGSVDGGAVEFQFGGDQFRIECSAPVAPGGRRPLFVFLQQGVSVKSPRFGSGGAPSLSH
jgi:hypothetical protein